MPRLKNMQFIDDKKVTFDYLFYNSNLNDTVNYDMKNLKKHLLERFGPSCNYTKFEGQGLKGEMGHPKKYTDDRQFKTPEQRTSHFIKKYYWNDGMLYLSLESNPKTKFGRTLYELLKLYNGDIIRLDMRAEGFLEQRKGYYYTNTTFIITRLVTWDFM